MTLKRRNGPRVTRRQVIAAGAGLGALAAVRCGNTRTSGTRDAGVGADAGANDTGIRTDGGVVDLGTPEISAALWQTMGPYVRASADGSIGTRVNLYNPSPVPQRVVIQVFLPDGTLVIKDFAWDAFPPGEAYHLELDEYLATKGVPLPFEGSLWVGTTPQSGITFMGLQGIGFDWYGPAHLASVHGMRDFGNSNHDTMWTDLILPKLVSNSRFTTKLAFLNASADGIAEALIAEPEVILRNDDGTEILRTTLDPLAPFCSRLVDVTDLTGGTAINSGTIQVREPEAGLVVNGFVFDLEHDGIASADHLFDRHFVTSSTGFIG